MLVDMTAVAADISVRQMRGRSLRLDPRDPAKLANNWDVVCVAPDLGRGHADYLRFVRRHAHLHAPCEDGTIETGPSHVHPELSPYGPPAEERFTAINLEQRDRAQDLDAARDRWQIGVAYRGVDLDALVVRDPPRRAPEAERRAARRRPARALVAAAAARPRAGSSPTSCRSSGRPAPCARRTSRSASCRPRRRRRCRFTVRPEGWVRVSLPDADPDQSTQVCAAIDELMGGGALPRYVVSRKAAPGRTVWHAVPADLARRRDRADAFHAAWRRWCGKSRARLRARRRARDRARRARPPAPGGLETQRRRVWR